LGDLLVSSFNTHSVLRYNPATAAYLGVFVAVGSGGLVNPHGLEFGPDGNLYVASFGNNRVLRYNGTTGAFLDVFVPVGALVAAPTGLLFTGGDTPVRPASWSTIKQGHRGP
jgi:DNA-binding beta-propeller fold protein YncE